MCEVNDLLAELGGQQQMEEKEKMAAPKGQQIIS